MNCKNSCPAVRQVMFPKDCDPSGNIFGGIILSHIDIAGAIAAKKLTVHRLVTVSMDTIVLKKPVLVGDILTCWAEVVEKGRTSLKVKITVESERQGQVIPVTEGYAKYVAVDKEHRSIPWDSPAGTVAQDSAAPVRARVEPKSLTKPILLQLAENDLSGAARRCPAVRQAMFPKDTNPSGNIFGGIILSHIDIAGAIAAKQLTEHRVVTVAMDTVIFKKPVLIGDILTCWTEVIKKGRTSIQVKVTVEAERHGEIISVTEGNATYVAVDKDHKPVPWNTPLGTTADQVASGEVTVPAHDSDSEQDCGCNHGPVQPEAEPVEGAAKKKKKNKGKDKPKTDKKKKKNNKKEKKGKKKKHGKKNK